MTSLTTTGTHERGADIDSPSPLPMHTLTDDSVLAHVIVENGMINTKEASYHSVDGITSAGNEAKQGHGA